MKRLFVESDHLDEMDLRRAQRKVYRILKDLALPMNEDVFDETVDFAWHQPDKTWAAILRSDEIYGDTSLTPLIGGSYSGSPVVMNVMMQKAIDEKIVGKSVIFLRPYDDIEWDMIDMDLVEKCFIGNKLFTTEFTDNYILNPIDIQQLVTEQRKN